MPSSISWEAALLRVELTKQLFRVRSLAALIVICALPIAAAISTAGRAGSRNGTQGGVYGASTFSALNHTAASLLFCVPVLLPLAAALFGSSLGAADRGWGTLRYLYVQPVAPRRLIAGKCAGLVACAALTTLALLVCSTAVGAVVFGWHPFHRLGTSNLSVATATVRLLAAGAYVTVAMVGVGAIALALGLLMPGPAEALAATIVLVVLATVIAAQPSLHAVAPFLPVHYWQRWTALLQGGHRDLLGGLAVQLVTIGIALSLAVLVSRRRDPAA